MEIFRLVFSPIEVNTYILTDGSPECIIIDCGCYNQEEFLVLTGFLEKKQLVPGLLLNTHCHLDHIFGNRLLLERYGIRSFSHEGDEENRLNSVNHSLFFGLKMEAPPEPGGFISDGQLLSLGSMKLKALHVPGHSMGSLAFYSEQTGVVFTGDALFNGSIGRTDLPGGNYNILITSIKDKLFTLPAGTSVYPGHGERTTIGQEINTNPYFSGKKVR